MKKLIALVAIITMLVSTPLLAYDVDGEENRLLPVGRVGQITEYYEGRLTVEFGEYDAVILHIQPHTVVIDAETGLPASIENRTHDRVKIYHSPIMAMSFPPQSSAYVIAINLPENTHSPFLHIIEEVYWADENAIRLTVDNGELHIHLNRETPLNPHRTRQFIVLEHLQVGDQLLFWYDTIARSMPGQTWPTNVLFIRNAQQEDELYEPLVQPLPTVAELIELNAGVERNGVELFPVRAILEAAGFIVDWDNETRAAIVTEPPGFDRRWRPTFKLPTGSFFFYVDDMPHLLPHPIVIINNTMHAPAVFFEAL